jgi:putative ABC transport system substrate-binding protein
MDERKQPYGALFGELRRLRYIEGQNLIVERYSGEGNSAHHAELASEVVRQQPDVIFKAASATIPIVGVMGDPVAVTNFNHCIAEPI